MTGQLVDQRRDLIPTHGVAGIGQVVAAELGTGVEQVDDTGRQVGGEGEPADLVGASGVVDVEYTIKNTTVHSEEVTFQDAAGEDGQAFQSPVHAPASCAGSKVGMRGGAGAKKPTTVHSRP